MSSNDSKIGFESQPSLELPDVFDGVEIEHFGGNGNVEVTAILRRSILISVIPAGT